MSKSGWLVIANAMIIDGTGAAARPGTVASHDGLVVTVGDFDAATIPRGAIVDRIDAAGKTVMPGLIDAHCHMTYGESRSEEEIDLYTSPEGRTLRAAWNAAKVLRAGVTSISQPGGSYFIGVGLRDAIAEGFVQGPRMSSAGRYLTTSNGLTDWYPDSVGVPDGSIGILTNTLPQMVDEIRRQAKAGVDFIKIADSPLGNYQAFTGDELKAMADLAHQLGKRITIHARGSAEVLAAVQAGFDWIMHGNYMSDDTIAALAESRIPLIPTLTLLANSTDYGAQVGVPGGLYDAWARLMDSSGDTLHRAHDAGVVFATGTDSGFSLTPYGEWHARELTLLADYAGLSPMEAIQAATRNAAATIQTDQPLGVLVPGAIADMIVVRGDPLADITVLERRENIEVVISNGRRVDFDEDALARRWPHQRGITYSEDDLFYRPDSPRRQPPHSPDPVATQFSDSEHDLASDIKARERAADVGARPDPAARVVRMKRHAEIAGAGLAGLSAGIALADRGWSVRVHERAPDLRMFGAGIWLWDNGLRSLALLGALERTIRDARRIKQWAIIDERGQDIMRHDFAAGENMMLPLRSDLYEALITRAQQAGVDIVTESTVASATPDGTLMLASGKAMKADLVVAADGAYSKIRDGLLLADRISNLREGYIRLVVDAQPEDETSIISECWNGARRFLYCPCTDKVHYVALICHVDDLRGRSDPVDREYWAEHFPAWEPIIKRLSAMGRWDRGMTVTNRSWSSGRVVLVGDAAHAMAPNLGQGANMTFTNAVSLAAAVSAGGDIPDALQGWERRERPLTDHVQRWSHGYGVLVSRWPDGVLALRGPALQFLTELPWVSRQMNRAAEYWPVGSDRLPAAYAERAARRGGS